MDQNRTAHGSCPIYCHLFCYCCLLAQRPRFYFSLSFFSLSKSFLFPPESTVIYEAPTPSPTPPQIAKDEFLSLTANLTGTYGFYFYQLESKYSYGIREKEIFPAASLIKLPVLITLYQLAQSGQINLDEVYALKEQDKVGGAGSLQYASAGTQKTFRQLAQAMCHSSDNTAAHIVATRLTVAKIQATISQIGMTQTSYQDNTTTPEDMGILLQKLYSDQLISPEYKQELFTYLTDTEWESLIPTGLPPGITTAHKYGSEVATWSDAGIIFTNHPFVLVIMSRDAVQSQAFDVIPQFVKLIYREEAN